MLPLVPVYAAGWALRAAGLLLGAEPVRRLKWPVVSVGNLSVGGAGKTPLLKPSTARRCNSTLHIFRPRSIWPTFIASLVATVTAKPCFGGRWQSRRAKLRRTTRSV